jgi:hypothetical protein
MFMQLDESGHKCYSYSNCNSVTLLTVTVTCYSMGNRKIIAILGQNLARQMLARSARPRLAPTRRMYANAMPLVLPRR